MSTDRNLRRLQNSKNQSISDGGQKTVLSHPPSSINMSEGEQVFSKSPNKPLALYKKLKGLLWKSYFSTDGNQYVDKNLIVNKDINLKKGNLKIDDIPIFEANSTGQSNLLVNAVVQIQFANETIDNTSSFSSHLFTVPVSGYYIFYYNLAFNAFDTGMTSATVSLRYGGSDYFASTRIDDKEFSADTDNSVSKSACCIKKATVGNTIGAYYLQIGGTAQVDVVAERNVGTDPYPASSSFGGYLISKIW